MSNVTNVTSPAEPSNAKPRNWWDKAEIIGKISGALIPAIFLGGLTFFGKQLAETFENRRLYTDLLTRREQADTELRKDMFSVVMKEFLSNVSQTSPTDHENKSISSNSVEHSLDVEKQRFTSEIQGLSSQMLKLELLAYNFNESISLAPIFGELSSRFYKISNEIENASTVAADDRNRLPTDDANRLLAHVNVLNDRLNGLAKRIADSQIEAIKVGGKKYQIVIPLERAHLFKWQNGDETEQYDDDAKGVACGSEDRIINRDIQLRFSGPDIDTPSIKVEAQITEVPSLQDGDVKSRAEPIRKTFTLNYFNFPMIDNTRLPNDQRFALVMTGFDPPSIDDRPRLIKITALCFSSNYSSVRDRPFLNEVIDNLSSE